jgi:hypothetical protein
MEVGGAVWFIRGKSLLWSWRNVFGISSLIDWETYGFIHCRRLDLDIGNSTQATLLLHRSGKTVSGLITDRERVTVVYSKNSLLFILLGEELIVGK